MKLLKFPIVFSVLIFFSGCIKDLRQTGIYRDQSTIAQAIPSALNTQAALTGSSVENFETGAKATYTEADLALATGTWNFNDALLGNLSTDVKNGAQSARLRNSGKLTMKF